jgi:hypothetical protein
LGTQLISRISDSFGINLPLLSLFDHPTVAGMSAEIERLILAKIEAGEAKDFCRVVDHSGEGTQA